jgi:hypothetical protein
VTCTCSTHRCLVCSTMVPHAEMIDLHLRSAVLSAPRTVAADTAAAAELLQSSAVCMHTAAAAASHARPSDVHCGLICKHLLDLPPPAGFVVK